MEMDFQGYKKIIYDCFGSRRPPRGYEPAWLWLSWLAGFDPKRYAVSVSGNWRITFAFDGEDAVDVDLEDYH